MNRKPFNLVEHMRKANANIDANQETFLRAFEAALEERSTSEDENLSQSITEALRATVGDLPENETITSQIRSIAEQLDKVEKRSVSKLDATAKFQLRKMIDDSKDKIVEAIRSGQDFELKFDAMRAAAKHLDTNVMTDAGTFIMPDVENYLVNTDIAKIRYPENFILSVIRNTTVARVPAQEIRVEQEPVQGAVAVVAEGGTKPLVSFQFVRTSTPRKKYAGRIEWSEEFEMDNDRLFAEILRLFEDQVIRTWQNGIITQMIANATAYTTSVLNGTLVTADNGIAAVAASSVIAGMNFNPDTVIMHPSDYVAAMFTQNSEGTWQIVPWLMNGKINGMNVILSNAVTQGNALIGDSSTYYEWHSSFILRFGMYNDQFIKNEKSAIGEVFSLLTIAAIHEPSWMYINLAAVKASLAIA